MKKLILSAAILLGSLSAFANNINESQLISSIETIVQDEFTEIAVDAVPDAVKATVETVMAGAVIEKAYINENKEYKLDIKTVDQNTTIFTDASGAILKK